MAQEKEKKEATLPETPEKSEDDGYDLDDIDTDMAILESMDVDNDFCVWNSFRSSIPAACLKCFSAEQGTIQELVDENGVYWLDETRIAGDDTAEKETREKPPPRVQEKTPKLTIEEQLDLRKWRRRADRSEVYSNSYRPNLVEEKEVKDLSSFLGVGENNVMGKLKLLSHTSTTRPLISKILHPEKDDPKSILLKRGPVLLMIQKRKLTGTLSIEGEERELLLLTNGFIIATVAQDRPKHNPLSGLTKNIPLSKILRRKFEKCEAISSIRTVIDHSLLPLEEEQTYNKCAFSIVIHHDTDGKAPTNTPLTFVCASKMHKEAWIYALQPCVMMCKFSKHVQKRKKHTPYKGVYNHTVFQSSMYAAAILDHVDMMKKCLTDEAADGDDYLNRLDQYGYTVLHYAAMMDSLQVLEYWMGLGCDLNVVSATEGKSALDFVKEHASTKFDLKKCYSLLENKGAKSMYDPALPEAKEASQSSTASNSQTPISQVSTMLSETKNAFLERGEKLTDAEMRTRELEDHAKDFKKAAKDLKEKMKKQNSIRGFFGFGK